MKKRRILLFTGNGKGKSTAAFGMLARPLGALASFDCMRSFDRALPIEV